MSHAKTAPQRNSSFSFDEPQNCPFKDEPFPWDFFIANHPSTNNSPHLDSPPGKRADLAPLVVFRAFRELAGSDNRYLAAYRESLDKVARTNPDDAEVLSGLGSIEPGGASAENAAKTIDLLSRAVERGSTRSSDYMFSRRFWRRMAAGRMR